MKISFVTTIFRTAHVAEQFATRCFTVAETMKMACEIVFVNDGSPDNGLQVATALAKGDARIVVVDLSRNYGQHKAIWTGLGVATGDLLMILDGDLEEDPAWAAGFHRAMLETGADVAYGVQRQPKGSLLYRASRRLFYRLLDLISDLKFPHDVTTARVMTRGYVDALLSFEERELFLVGVMHAAGFRQTPIVVDKRSSSATTYSAGKLLSLFLMAVTSFSIKPLVGVFVAGIVISATAFAVIIILIAGYLFLGIGVPGWTSVVAGMMLFSGISILFTGLIAIYVGVIFLEVKRRPRTIVAAIYRDGASPARTSAHPLVSGGTDRDTVRYNNAP